VIFEEGKLSAMAQAMEKPMREYLKCKEIAERYARGKASTLAKCFLLAEGETMKEKEMQALASKPYGEYLDLWHQAQLLANDARVEYETRLNLFYAYQSELSYLRETVKHHGG